MTASGGMEASGRLRDLACSRPRAGPFKPDPATPPSIRARTAQCILECANKSLELEDIEARIARLEENEQRERGDSD